LGEESARNDGPRFQANVSEEDLRVKEDERVERGFAVVKAKLNRLLLKVGRMFERGQGVLYQHFAAADPL
jgi:hypothetical protein